MNINDVYFGVKLQIFFKLFAQSYKEFGNIIM